MQFWDTLFVSELVKYDGSASLISLGHGAIPYRR